MGRRGVVLAAALLALLSPHGQLDQNQGGILAVGNQHPTVAWGLSNQWNICSRGGLRLRGGHACDSMGGVNEVSSEESEEVDERNKFFAMHQGIQQEQLIDSFVDHARMLRANRKHELEMERLTEGLSAQAETELRRVVKLGAGLHPHLRRHKRCMFCQPREANADAGEGRHLATFTSLSRLSRGWRKGQISLSEDTGAEVSAALDCLDRGLPLPVHPESRFALFLEAVAADLSQSRQAIRQWKHDRRDDDLHEDDQEELRVLNVTGHEDIQDEDENKTSICYRGSLPNASDMQDSPLWKFLKMNSYEEINIAAHFFATGELVPGCLNDDQTLRALILFELIKDETHGLEFESQGTTPQMFQLFRYRINRNLATIKMMKRRVSGKESSTLRYVMQMRKQFHLQHFQDPAYCDVNTSALIRRKPARVKTKLALGPPPSYAPYAVASYSGIIPIPCGSSQCSWCSKSGVPSLANPILPRKAKHFTFQHHELVRHARMEALRGLNATEARMKDRKAQNRTYAFMAVGDTEIPSGVSDLEESDSESVGIIQKLLQEDPTIQPDDEDPFGEGGGDGPLVPDEPDSDDPLAPLDPQERLKYAMAKTRESSLKDRNKNFLSMGYSRPTNLQPPAKRPEIAAGRDQAFQHKSGAQPPEPPKKRAKAKVAQSFIEDLEVSSLDSISSAI